MSRTSQTVRRSATMLLPGLGGVLFLFGQALHGQSEIDIRSLRSAFETTYKNEQVSIHGWVSAEKRVASSTYKGYYLRDRYGDLILVRSTEAVPDVNTEVTITGVALRDADTQAVYVSESRRGTPPPTTAPPATPPPAAGSPTSKPAADAEPPPADNTNLHLLGIGGAVVVLIGIALFLMRRKVALAPAAASTPFTAADAYKTVRTGPSTEGPGSVEDYRTVKVYKTTKVLPAKLVAMQGAQETDMIHLYDQTGRGEVEIGRDSPDVHDGIRLKDASNTMSRRQARLVYAAASREFKITNLAGASSNPTVINGRDMKESETAALRDGDMLRLGNLEFRFRQG